MNNQLDKCKSKLVSAQQREANSTAEHIISDIDKIDLKIAQLKQQQADQVNGKGKDIQALAFNRPITNAEQADMGKLKKSVRGLIVVHPMTALGRDMGIKVVTGYASAEF